ncbi:MAG: hypothetical protein Q4D93_04455, partial [Porphyromonas sp.]|nr:hypothetical protein [Porphyromonas sp.]
SGLFCIVVRHGEERFGGITWRSRRMTGSNNLAKGKRYLGRGGAPPWYHPNPSNIRLQRMLESHPHRYVGSL